jgi:hypothetical protein
MPVADRGDAVAGLELGQVELVELDAAAASRRRPAGLASWMPPPLVLA